jgi:ribosomal protein S18 acetylase RimI-like enzyme
LTVSVVKVEANNVQHKADLKTLIAMYSDETPVDIDPSVVDTLLTLPYLKGFLCYEGSKAAGFAICYESFSTYRQQFFLNVHDLMIDKGCRGKGLSRILLETVLTFSREQDYLKVTLEVDDENTIAKKLYASCGFEDHQVKLKGLLHWQVYL